MRKECLYREDGTPLFIQCYEKKRNPTADRFTVVFQRARAFMRSDEWRERVYFVVMSGNPYSPVGFYQHGEAWRYEFCPGGSRVKFSDLPVNCQKAVRQEYEELWRNSEDGV